MVNREFIQREKRMRRIIHEIVPAVYASFCISLHRRFGFGYNRILTVLSDTQDLFIRHGNGEINVIQLCSDELGIDVLSEQTAKETGAKGEKI